MEQTLITFRSNEKKSINIIDLTEKEYIYLDITRYEVVDQQFRVYGRYYYNNLTQEAKYENEILVENARYQKTILHGLYESFSFEDLNLLANSLEFQYEENDSYIGKRLKELIIRVQYKLATSTLFGVTSWELYN